MSRSTLSERAQRLNAAFHLLADGRSLNEAAEAMAEQHRISRRQAYRYLQEARHSSSPVAVAEPPGGTMTDVKKKSHGWFVLRSGATEHVPTNRTNSLAVDCSNPGSVPSQYAECCTGIVDKTVQERAWTSPIFYQPERLGVKKGRILFGSGSGADKLHLDLTIGRVPPELDVKTNGLTLTLRDDDVIYSAALPAGALTETVPGRGYRLNDPSGAIAGIRKARLRISRRGTARLIVDTIPVDLSHAQQSSHRIDTELASGAYDQRDSRIWESSPERLEAQL